MAIEGGMRDKLAVGTRLVAQYKGKQHAATVMAGVGEVEEPLGDLELAFACGLEPPQRLGVGAREGERLLELVRAVVRLDVASFERVQAGFDAAVVDTFTSAVPHSPFG